MGNATDPSVIALERDYPDYQCWTVSRWDGTAHTVVWCARRRDGAGKTHNAYSEYELVEYIEEELHRP